MTAEQTREMLVGTAKAVQQQLLAAPVEDDAPTGRIGRRESLEQAGRLVSYLEALPLDDPRLNAIAANVADLAAFTELIPGDGMVPVTGPEMMDYFAALAKGKEGED